MRTCLLLLTGRYLFLNAIANQLRYPNSHTHYFSCTLLYLFAEANTEAIQEQITRYIHIWQGEGEGDEDNSCFCIFVNDIFKATHKHRCPN